MTKNNCEDTADWSLTTRKGSRLRQHREFLALPFRRKMELLEEMCGRARKLSNLSDYKGQGSSESPKVTALNQR